MVAFLRSGSINLVLPSVPYAVFLTVVRVADRIYLPFTVAAFHDKVPNYKRTKKSEVSDRFSFSQAEI